MRTGPASLGWRRIPSCLRRMSCMSTLQRWFVCLQSAHEHKRDFNYSALLKAVAVAVNVAIAIAMELELEVEVEDNISI